MRSDFLFKVRLDKFTGEGTVAMVFLPPSENIPTSKERFYRPLGTPFRIDCFIIYC